MIAIKMAFVLVAATFIAPSAPAPVDHLKFEGDIILPKYEMDHLDALLNGTLYDDLDRNAMRNPHGLWPGGVVPYTISTTGISARDRKVIKEAMAEYSNKTCIKFKPRTNERDYIDFVNRDDGCWSYVGRSGLGNGQPLSGCAHIGSLFVLHELMHALGFWHEHSRADRDEYIEINFKNIEWGMEDQFRKNALNIMTHLGAEYDYCSIMHYPATAFSKNLLDPTIVPKKSTGGCEIGQSNHLSDTDIREINTLYKCEGYPQIERCVDNSSLVTNGDSCVLPFTYGGNDYNGCTNVGHTRAWCATKKQQTGSWWRNCPSGCKMHSEDSAASCQNGIGEDYSGFVSKTISGFTCQIWTSRYGSEFIKVGDHNYCRNPDGESGVWCFSTNKNEEWELCDVPVCNTEK